MERQPYNPAGEDELSQTGSVFDPSFLTRDPEFVNAWGQATGMGTGSQGSPNGGGGLPWLPSRGLPSNMAGLSPAITGNVSAGVGAGAGAGAGAAGAGAAGAAGLFSKSKIAETLAGLAGLLFGSQGPLGGGNSNMGLEAFGPQIQDLLKLQQDRLGAQGPLWSAVQQGAYDLLPRQAKEGTMFTLPGAR